MVVRARNKEGGNRLPAVAPYRQVKGSRSRGRQPKKWMDNVKEDLTAQGMNMREAVDTSRNRSMSKIISHLLRPPPIPSSVTYFMDGLYVQPL